MRLQGRIHFMDETVLENEELEELLVPILDEARSQGDSRFVSAEDEDGMPVFAPSQTLGHSNF